VTDDEVPGDGQEVVVIEAADTESDEPNLLGLAGLCCPSTQPECQPPRSPA
jgi:hypothetical protein